VPNRHGSSTAYRYSFQGQEKDDEIKGEGNSLNYTFRMHDPRLGRFFAVDPLRAKYPFYSPYSFSGNKVIAFVELEGLEDRWVVKDNAVVHEREPRVGTMDSEATARATLAKSQSAHRA
jgi:RHS repeat-associated protein